MKPADRKPGYSLTRRAFWISFWLAWTVIFMTLIAAVAGVQAAVELAPVTVPSMVGLIAALLGIHRFTGAMDMRTATMTEPA